MAFDKILVLDDEMIIRKTLENLLRNKRYRVQTAQTIEEAENRLETGIYDLVFCDVRLPDGNGMDFLERHANRPNAPVFVMITGHGTVENAVHCMRSGAFDYVIKPFSGNRIDVILDKAEKFDRLIKVNNYYNHESQPDTELIGESPLMRSLKTLISRVARTDATVLISGETGTGKELIAREVFRMSNRSKQSFIKVNCAAVSETLMESEFFGHEKGAFTGAVQKREGRFELADGGSLLLDEVSEIPPSLQAKLLRVLQEKEFERVGGNKPIQVDARVIATTNRDLSKAIANGEFRQDLFYRLNVFPLQAPPLRERKEDIPLLVNKFLRDLSRKHGINIKGCSSKAMQLLLSYDWPGNVRELQNTIEHAVIMSSPDLPLQQEAIFLQNHNPQKSVPPPHINNSHPPEPIPESTDDQPESLAVMERKYILNALLATNGNRTQASKILDISIRTLRNKLNTYREQSIPEFKQFEP